MYIRKARHVAPAHARNDAPVALFKSSDKRVSRPTRLCLRTPTRFLHTHTLLRIYIFNHIFIYVYLYRPSCDTPSRLLPLSPFPRFLSHVSHAHAFIYYYYFFFLFEEKNNRYVYHICINTMNGMSKLVAQ